MTQKMNTASGFNHHTVGIKRNFLLTAPDFFFSDCFFCLFNLEDVNERHWLAAVSDVILLFGAFGSRLP